jgi:hypothetical protein
MGLIAVPPRSGRVRRESRSALGVWENEGGLLARASSPRPKIKVILCERYRVGRYEYTDLACAESELRRQLAGLAPGPPPGTGTDFPDV